MNVCKDNKNMQNELKKLDRYIKELREKISNILEHLCIDGLRPRHKERINKAFGPLDFDILTS
jgi:dynein heavy chain, axonemal